MMSLVPLERVQTTVSVPAGSSASSGSKALWAASESASGAEKLPPGEAVEA